VLKAGMSAEERQRFEGPAGHQPVLLLLAMATGAPVAFIRWSDWLLASPTAKPPNLAAEASEAERPVAAAADRFLQAAKLEDLVFWTPRITRFGFQIGEPRTSPARGPV